MWTPRDLDIVETLTRRVRLLSFAQLQRGWWSETTSPRTVQDRLSRLVKAGLLQRTVANVRCLTVTRPLHVWRPGGKRPHAVRVSQQAHRRWPRTAAPTELFFATKLAANLFGSHAGRFPKLEHRDHDLLLGDVFVFYRRQRPTEAPLWNGEDTRPKAGFRVKDPDAFLLDANGKTVRVIESAGSYSPRQVESFHQHCVEHELAYELW